MPGLSRADNEVAMKQEFSLSTLDSHSDNKLATLSFFIGLALAFPVSAELRIVGPSFDASSPMNSAPSEIRDKPLPTISTTSELLYEGPTQARDTLWSIASRYQPKNAGVSVYQTIGAIFKLNPAVFKDGNIHGLIPGSFLAMPTLDQIRAENTDEFVKLLQMDKAPISSVNAESNPSIRFESEPSKKTVSKANVKPVNSPLPSGTELDNTLPNTKNDVVTSEAASNTIDYPQKTSLSAIPPKPTVDDVNSVSTAQTADTSLTTELTNLSKIPQNSLEIKGDSINESGDVSASTAAEMENKPSSEGDLLSLQSQLENSELEVGKLMESNALLKRQLAEVQSELDALKEEIVAGKELDNEFKKYLDEQKALTEASEVESSSFIETLIANPLLLGALALLPGLAIIGFGAYVIARRPEELADEATIDRQLEELASLDSGLTLGDDEVKLNVETPDDDLYELSDIDDLFNDKELFAKEDSPASEMPDDMLSTSENQQVKDGQFADESVGVDVENEVAAGELDEKENVLLEDMPESLDDVFADIKEEDKFKSATPDIEGVDAQAVGLEDIERAIDELDIPSETVLSPDEAMAASWEAALNESNNLSVDAAPSDDVPNTAEGSEPQENNKENTEAPKNVAENVSQAPNTSDLIDEGNEQTVVAESSNKNITVDIQEKAAIELAAEDSKPVDETNVIDLDSSDDNDLEDPLGLTSTEVYADDIPDELPKNVSINPSINELESQLEPSINIDELNDIQTNAKPNETIDLTSIAEYTEVEAAADIESSVASDSSPKHNDEITRPTLSETDPIDLEALSVFDEKDAMNAAQEEMAINAADMSNINELSKTSTDETSGLDMTALLADMDTFDIPENESNIWNAKQAPEPNLESEDWSVQPEMPKDEIRLIDLDEELESWLDDAESELVEKSASNEPLISIEDLVEDSGKVTSYHDNDFSIGINDFASKSSGNKRISLDTSEAANNMDLAKAYIAMNDLDGANILLNKILRSNNDSFREEAVQLLESIK